MKKIKYIFVAAALGLTMSSCYDLDLEPKGLIYENVLMKSESGLQKYWVMVFQDLPIEDFNFAMNGEHNGFGTVCAAGWHEANQWGAQKASPASAAMEATGRTTSYGDGWGYWPYDRIRDINNFMEQFPNYKEYYNEETYENLYAEAFFLRAFYYFGLVKRYGGVPIVDKVLDPKAPLAELQLPRSTEYDCWMFIHNDLEYAMNHMSTAKGDASRPNRYAAAALMSRAMLYAASAAKYGSYGKITGPAVDAGLMGVAPEKAKEFYQYAYDACKFVKEGGYALNDGSDKETAYAEQFFKDNTPEDIFIKQYGDYIALKDNQGTMLFHSWDSMILPKGSNLSISAPGCTIQPAWELIRMFEIPAVTDEEGKPVRFDNVEDLWNSGEMEPRARAIFFFSGMTEKGSGTKFDFQAGVYKSYPGTAADGTTETGGSTNDYTNAYRVTAQNVEASQMYQDIGDQKNVKVAGPHGCFRGTGDEGYSYMGVLIRKYTNPNSNLAIRGGLFGSSQSWKVFRYGEVLLNWAEAAYELGLETGDDKLKAEAFTYVNEVRARAGATLHQMVNNPEDLGMEKYGFPVDENLQYIRDERARELCFENLRIYDLRRWRVADIDFMDGKQPHTLLPYYVLNENKWIFLNEVPVVARKATFDKKWYYEQIPGGEIGKNPNLIRNDGY